MSLVQRLLVRSALRSRRSGTISTTSRLLHVSHMPGAQWRVQHPNPERVVLVSTSTSIFENLALETWLYEKGSLDRKHYLLMWRNTPAVVIGRHQNPWLEANVPAIAQAGVALARRQSGGGTVYHDLGNLNLSFLTSRQLYNRKHNLQLVVTALTHHFDLDLSINSRDDIILNGLYKVSGTASKLGGKRAYHHFTLLLDVDKQHLQHFLHSQCLGVDTRATPSIPASTINLREVEPALSFDSAVETIGAHFLQRPPEQAKDSAFQLVNPMEEAAFPGVGGLVQELRDPEWVFGKTPKFSISRIFSRTLGDRSTVSVTFDVEIVKGRVGSLNWQLSTPFFPPASWEGFATSVQKNLVGVPLWESHVQTVLEAKEIFDSDELTKEFCEWFLSSLGECLLV